MIHQLEALRHGFDIEADVAVVGSGAGGAVAAANLARAGLRTVVLEAGPRLEAADMTRDAPRFMARYFWDGGLRLAGGESQVPIMQGRVLGGSTVVNSAILYELPAWVRRAWVQDEGLTGLEGPELGRAFARVFAITRTAPTPLAVMGRRNLVVRDALSAAGIPNNPLPRAVVDCGGCGDCLTGCHHGAKQSVDRCYLPLAERDGADVYTCAQVERLDFAARRAYGVSGWVVDPHGQRRLARFTVRAPRVVLAAGAVNTPVLLRQSGVGGQVGEHLAIHMTAGCVGFMPERVDPWFGATQGWGAISADIPGLKYESLWCPPSVIMVRWGDVGVPFYRDMLAVKNSLVIALVYRGRVTGRVRPGLFGPRLRLHFHEDDVRTLMRGLRLAVDGLLRAGADHVYTGIPGIAPELRSTADSEALVTSTIRARDVSMTGNHVFGSCRMSASADRGAVDPQGRVYGVDGVWVADASLFPSPSAVNPQATVMALADLITRRIGELGA